MGLRTVYSSGRAGSQGRTTWHNAAKHAIRVKLYKDKGAYEVIEIDPGSSIDLDSGYDVNIKKISPYLKKGPGPAKPTPPAPKQPAPQPEPEPAEAKADDAATTAPAPAADSAKEEAVAELTPEPKREARAARRARERSDK